MTSRVGFVGHDDGRPDRLRLASTAARSAGQFCPARRNAGPLTAPARPATLGPCATARLVCRIAGLSKSTHAGEVALYRCFVPRMRVYSRRHLQNVRPPPTSGRTFCSSRSRLRAGQVRRPEDRLCR
jgi:hypothetical protein